MIKLVETYLSKDYLTDKHLAGFDNYKVSKTTSFRKNIKRIKTGFLFVIFNVITSLDDVSCSMCNKKKKTNCYLYLH